MKKLLKLKVSPAPLSERINYHAVSLSGSLLNFSRPEYIQNYSDILYIKEN